MAVDEALLADAADCRVASLRFYQWRQPTLSLGYFQSWADRPLHDLEVVRRPSGGGALLHDRELTYAAVLPASHSLARGSTALYEAVHGALMEALAELGLATRFHRDGGGESGQVTDNDYFCFVRRSEFDILATDALGCPATKVVGSAQRRRRGAVLQHGAILLAASPHAPELGGILECTGADLSPQSLIESLVPRMAVALSMRLAAAESTESLDPERIQNLAQRYGSTAWLGRR